VDISRLSLGERIAGVSGLVLLIALWFPWYEASLLGASESANAWEVFDVIDVILFLVAVTAMALVVAKAAGVLPADLPAPAGTIIAGVGALAVILILYRLLDVPGPDVDGVDVGRKIGIFIGLLAAGGVTYGGYSAMNEPGGVAPARTGPTPPAA
jgi:hypothetical protein